MNITPAVIKQIKEFLGALTGTAAELAAILNDRNINNPIPKAADVPNDFNFSTLAGLLGPTTAGRIANYIHLDRLIDDIRARDREAILLWSSVLTAGGILEPSEATAISNAVNASVPDPKWRAQISWIELEFGMDVVIRDDEVEDNIINDPTKPKPK